jgi:protein-disulfide isomerase
MYEAQDEEHGGFGDEPTVIELTKKIAGIDATRVTAATKAKKSEYEALITSDRTEAQGVGLTSTPSFVIGDKPLIGAQPYAAFDTAIKAALAK